MSSAQVLGLLAQKRSYMVQYGRILVQYGRILVQYGRIWSHKLSKQVNTNICPEMIQNGLEMVPIASGGPGNRFLLYNNVFLYQYKGPFFPIIYYPYSPVKFLILGLLNSFDRLCYYSYYPCYPYYPPYQHLQDRTYP